MNPQKGESGEGQTKFPLIGPYHFPILVGHCQAEVSLSMLMYFIDDAVISLVYGHVLADYFCLIEIGAWQEV